MSSSPSSSSSSSQPPRYAPRDVATSHANSSAYAHTLSSAHTRAAHDSSHDRYDDGIMPVGGSSSSMHDMYATGATAMSSSSYSNYSNHAGGGSDVVNDYSVYDSDDDDVQSMQRLMVSVEYEWRRWWAQAVSLTLLAPLDRVRYVMMSRRELQRMGVLHGNLRSSLQCARYLTRLEGWRSLWRGNGVQMMSVLPTLLAQIFIALPTETMLLYMLPAHTQTGYTVASFAASVGGATAASVISYPLEFARFRMAADVRPYKGRPYLLRHSLDFFAQRVFTQSPHLLYTGFGLYVCGSILYGCLHTLLVRLIVPHLPPERDDDATATLREVWQPVVVQGVCGLGVASAATLCMHPFAVVRYRMMLAVTQRCLRYPSSLHCLATVLVREGVRGLYSGCSVTLARLVVADVIGAYMRR